MKLNSKIAKIFGYELIRRRRHPTSIIHILNLINHYKIDLVLDVGANYGRFGKKLRDEGYGGEIHSFEPVSRTFELLSETCLNDQNWFAHKMAIGDACGQETINITESSDLSSFLNPNEFGKDEFKKINVVQRETVEVRTIDRFITTQIADFDKKQILLKMDTQGYDLKVFKGALNTIAYIVCMLSEISVVPIYSDMPHYLDSLKEYEQYGFVVSGLYPITRRENLSIIEMDCILINSKKT